MKNLIQIFSWYILLLAGAASLSAQARPEHALRPNDTIEVRVFQEPELDAKVTLSQEGKVALPLIGEVAVGGMSAADASKAITTKYKEGYLANPSVTVVISDYAKQRFTILGAINKPGSFFFPAGETVSLLQAVGMAGGYSRLASPAKIMIKRANAKEPLKVDAKKMAKDGSASTFMIQPGDVITIGESLW